MSAPSQVSVRVTEEPGVFVIEVAYFGGRWRLAATIPTGDQAAYPEAVARNRANAVAHAAAFIADNYPSATVVPPGVPR